MSLSGILPASKNWRMNLEVNLSSSLIIPSTISNIRFLIFFCCYNYSFSYFSSICCLRGEFSWFSI